jgi:2-dehydropantoate 2-reductase
VAKAESAEVDAAAIESFLETMPATMRSSMAKDLNAGRRLELDGIAGPIVRGGETHGVAVPTTIRLMEMVSARVDLAEQVAS